MLKLHYNNILSTKQRCVKCTQSSTVVKPKSGNKSQRQETQPVLGIPSVESWTVPNKMHREEHSLCCPDSWVLLHQTKTCGIRKQARISLFWRANESRETAQELVNCHCLGLNISSSLSLRNTFSAPLWLMTIPPMPNLADCVWEQLYGSKNEVQCVKGCICNTN